jgi:hypothetical protein
LRNVAALREGRVAARRFIAAVLPRCEAARREAAPCIEVERSFEGAQLQPLPVVTTPPPAILATKLVEAAPITAAAEFIVAEPPSEVARL